MKKFLEIIKKCPLFDDIKEEELMKMLTCLGAHVEHFDKKYTVFSEGSPAKYIGILLSGNAQVVQHDYYGNRNLLTEIRPSEVFAEAFACADIPTLPVSVIAIEPCDVMFIDSAHILHTCSNHCTFHQQLIYNLMKDLAAKTILFHRRIEITSKRSTREKLMTYLMQRAKDANANSFEIPFDRQELADYLEVDRSGLSAEIGKLKKEGVLDAQKNRFTLL
ncbi:MAG: Crp/Fnr family transcriptional regulator [Clostridia bacterium]|nr:Crp/Fnr family transcriptional regulator [Clostridia bacterium]